MSRDNEELDSVVVVDRFYIDCIIAHSEGEMPFSPVGYYMYVVSSFIFIPRRSVLP